MIKVIDRPKLKPNALLFKLEHKYYGLDKTVIKPILFNVQTVSSRNGIGTYIHESYSQKEVLLNSKMWSNIHIPAKYHNESFKVLHRIPLTDRVIDFMNTHVDGADMSTTLFNSDHLISNRRMEYLDELTSLMYVADIKFNTHVTSKMLLEVCKPIFL